MGTIRSHSQQKPSGRKEGVLSRIAATQALNAIVSRGQSMKATFAAILPNIPDTRDRALIEALVFAVVRDYALYTAQLKKWLQRPLPKKQQDIQWVIFLGFAQLYTLKLPAHAAISASVDTCRALGWSKHTGMVNAVLRRAQREGLITNALEACWPKWLQQAISRDWPTYTHRIWSASRLPAPLWLRVNANKMRREAFYALLVENKIDAYNGNSPDAVCVRTSVPVSRLPGFAEGWVSVQDFSAQQAADLLTPRPGSRILDPCAAPGGKTAHLLERDASLRITAIDIRADRVHQLKNTLARLGLCADVLTADAVELSTWWDGEPFDYVLLDAPCSATGVIRRHPDILLHRRKEDVNATVKIQSQLLDACWHVLIPGGVLVYTTCSLLCAENDLQIQAFLSRTADAHLHDPGPAYGHTTPCGRMRFPGEDDGDGFFYARITKHSPT